MTYTKYACDFCTSSGEKSARQSGHFDLISASLEKGQPANALGRYQNVILTGRELSELQAEFPGLWQQYVEKLSEYMASTGRRYQNHAATIRRWITEDKPKIYNPDYSCKEGESL